MADAEFLDSQPECQWKFGSPIALDLPNLKGHGPTHLAEKRQTRARMELPIEAQHAVARAIVDARVLIVPAAPNLHDFMSIWTESPRRFFGKELQRHARRRASIVD